MQTQDDQSWIESLSQTDAVQCLSTLQALASQLDTAMNAIVQQKLLALHDSIHLQQVSCGRIADLRHRSDGMPSIHSDAVSVDADLALEIKKATESLLVLNARYSALLKHSGDTLHLLAGLYRSYSGFTQPTAGSQASLAGWSCEV